MIRRISVVCLICIFLLSGCGSSDKQVHVSVGAAESMIYIYYPDDKSIERDEQQYQLKQPDSITSSVEEVMTVLAQKLEDRLAYHTYMLDANSNLSLEFAENMELTKEERLLTDAAICETLFQIEDINAIDIELIDGDGNVIRDNMYTRESFYFYGYKETGMNERQLTLYYVDKAGTGLLSTEVMVTDEPNVTMEEKLVSLLVSRGSLSEKTTVNSIGVSEGICYIDLSSEFMSKTSNVTGEAGLYSLVNSIVSLPDVDAVLIMVEGELIHQYRGVTGTDEPLTFNSDILD